MVGRREHQRARVDHVREHSGIILRIRRDLGDGDVPGSLHELPELPVCHRMAVHPEAVHGDAMRRGFFRIMLVRAHTESTAGYPDHRLGLRGGVINGSIGLGRSCREKRRHFRALPLDRSPKRRTRPDYTTGRSLSQDIGPRSNIEPHACSATVARMRRILTIQTQEGAAEHGGALEAGKPIPLAQGQHDGLTAEGKEFSWRKHPHGLPSLTMIPPCSGL